MDELSIDCPHCGFRHENWQEFIDAGDMEGEFPTRCDSCDRLFITEFSTKIKFKTYLPEEAEKEKVKGFAKKLNELQTTHDLTVHSETGCDLIVVAKDEKGNSKKYRMDGEPETEATIVHEPEAGST